MAYNLARQTSQQKTARLPAKLSIIRHLYKKGFNRQDIINLFRFIDWVISLPKEDDDLFWKEVVDMEKEGIMPYITSVERIGYRRGLLDGEKRGEIRGEKRGEKLGAKLGKKVGLKDGQVSLLARLIARKFKSRVSLEKPLLNDLELKDLRTLSEKILDFKTLDEVHTWIDTRVNSKSTA